MAEADAIKLLFKYLNEEERLVKAKDRASWSIMKKFGAYVMRRAQRSIRQRKAISLPGNPPSSHVGTLKRLIYFDATVDYVIIGPIIAPGKKGTAPSTLEYGGRSNLGKLGMQIPVTLSSGKQSGYTVRGTLSYEARPFMNPAFQSVLPELPHWWANSVK
jgi:hypothetical protein